MSIAISKLHKILRSTDFEAFKSLNVLSGTGDEAKKRNNDENKKAIATIVHRWIGRAERADSASFLFALFFGLFFLFLSLSFYMNENLFDRLSLRPGHS